ncbi:uncharacterized protein LOC136088617 [Hydra vulgaris]|uniref:Uncharacterized protein LOC136088617 n=1 Tax=Hydra vulgaris TaxID=6087 RepID=A0ABM4D3J5_HYDVU
MALKSESTGNCLLSSFSICLSGDNSLVMDLRILTAIDLYFNPSFYSNHPSFVGLCLKYPNKFSSIDNLLAVSVSSYSVDSRKLKDLVKEEALHICQEFVWSGFLCILAFSTVCFKQVQCYYRTIGSLLKYKLMFNLKIKPHILSAASDILNLSFCFKGSNPPLPYKHNHYVPLVFVPGKKCLKRKFLCKKGSNCAKQLTITMFTNKYNTNQEPPISTIADKSFLYELNNNKFITSSHRNNIFDSFIDSKSCSSYTLLPLNENDCKNKK